MDLPEVLSYPQGYPNVLARGLKEDFSRATGLPIEEANYLMDQLGAVIQERLLRGLPSGIPFVGVIYVEFQHFRKIGVSGIRMEKCDLPQLNDNMLQMRMFAKPNFYVPRGLRHAVRDNAPFTGELKDHYNKENTRRMEIAAFEKQQRRERWKSGKRSSAKRMKKKRVEDKYKKESKDDGERPQENKERPSGGGQKRGGGKGKNGGQSGSNKRSRKNGKGTKDGK